MNRDHHNDEVVARAQVPGTRVVITITRRPANPRVAQLLDTPRGKGLWVDQYVVVRTVTPADDFVNYLSCAKDDEDGAREIANFLWTDTVERRDWAKAVGQRSTARS